MSFDSARSISWVIVSFTASSTGLSSTVQREYPSDFSSGLNSLRHLSTNRRGGSTSTISPVSATRPSGKTSRHDAPAFHALSWCMPNQYCLVNSALVSADHNFSGVVRMKVTYTNVDELPLASIFSFQVPS